MNLKEVKKIVWIDILIITFTIFCLVFSLIVILTDNVSASTLTTDITNSISIPSAYSGCTQTNGKYWGDDGSSSTCKVHNVKTTISGVLYSLEMVLKNAWVVNEVAFVQINGMSSDFRNNDLYCELTNNSNNSVPCDITFNSKSQLQVTFIPTQVGNYTLGIYSSSYSALTGINTYGIKSVIVKQQTGDNADIINNQNQNTSDIIDNNNQNTQDLIDNINGAFTELALSEKVNNSTCYNNGSVILAPSLEGYYIADTNGGTNSNMNYNVSYNYGVYGGQQYRIDFNNIDGLQYGRLCWYKDDTLLSCPQYRNMSGYGATNFVVTAPNDANYISLTYKRNVVSSIKGKICVSDSVMEQSTQKNQLDYLQDDSDPTIDDNAVDGVLDDVEYNDPLNYLLVLPLHTIQRINNALSSSSCSRITFGQLYGSELYLPCIDIEDHIGSNLFNTIDVMMGIGLLAITLKKFYDTISNILTLGKEKEIKDKLDLPTPMEFLALIFGGGR